MRKRYSLIHASEVIGCTPAEALRLLRVHRVRYEFGRYDGDQVDTLAKLAPELLAAPVAAACAIEPKQRPTQQRMEF